MRAASAATLTSTFLTLIITAGTATGEESPYGHADYYPSPNQPAQLRGDGSGYFPGAHPVAEFDFRTKKNIIWACRLPGWGFSSPIVVGDKAFVTCDWNKLVCVDVRSGKVLWEKDNHTFDAVGGDQAESLRTLFTELTVPWLQAHQQMFEKAYLEREIDLIEAAKAGKALAPRQAKHKGKMRDRKNWGPVCPHDHLTPAEIEQQLSKARSVDDATLQSLKDRYTNLVKTITDNQIGPWTSGYVPLMCPYTRHSANEKGFKNSKLPSGKTVHEAIKQLGKFGIVFELWNGWMGRSFSTPASDGTHVFAQFGQSQIVSYDLAGKRQWMTVIPKINSKIRRQSDSASLLLADDKVIVLMGGGDPTSDSYLQALDKKSGEILWQTYLDFHRSSHSFPNQTRVKHGDIDAIATGAGAIVDTRDGSIIMKDLPAPIAPPLVVNNEIYLMCGNSQSNGHGSRMKITLTRDGDKTVGTINWAFLATNIKEWETAAKAYNPELAIGKPEKREPASDVGALLIDGKVVLDSGSYDSATGTLVKKYGRRLARGHLIRTGNDLIISTAKDRLTPVFHIDKMDAPQNQALGSEWHRQLQLGQLSLEEAKQAIVELPWLPHVTGHFGGQSTVWPQGKRMYIRMHDTLYCIGDPKVPYHSPAKTPDAARTAD